MIHEKFGAPEGLYDRKSRYDFYTKADGYIFVSQSTKNDFSEFYPDLLATKPSQVIWHGSNYKGQESSQKRTSKQFLFVGARSGYKNFFTAAKAFCKIANYDPKIRLVVAGAPPLPDELELLKDYLNQIDWKIFPQDKELKDLYLSSLALLYTSNYEGFGMPLLEAMSQSCIPIAGNHSSIPEVVGNSGILVNTNSIEEVTTAMQKCLMEPAFAKSLCVRSENQLKHFNWNYTATKTFEFYKSI